MKQTQMKKIELTKSQAWSLYPVVWASQLRLKESLQLDGVLKIDGTRNKRNKYLGIRNSEELKELKRLRIITKKIAKTFDLDNS